MNKDQTGFAVLETLLILAIITTIAGIGWYAIHSKQQTDKILAQSEKTSQSTPSFVKKNIASTATEQNHLDIKEWGVGANYDGNLTISYSIRGNYADFTSKELSDSSGGCNTYGGHIERLLPEEKYDGGGPTAYQLVNDKNTSFSSAYSFVNGYYYLFEHDQSLCPDINDASSVAAQLQMQTEDTVKQIAKTLEISKQ